jgi:uncharacterized membrane protein
VIAFVAVILGTAWVVVVVAGPVLPAWAGAAVYGFGSFICHQLPERSFHLGGFQLPVCARCLGVYVGVPAGIAYASMWPGRRRMAFDIGASALRRLALALAAPTIVTVVLEAIGVWQTSNVTRALAGAPLGVFAGLVVASALATLHYDECAPPRPSVPRPPQPPI